MGWIDLRYILFYSQKLQPPNHEVILNHMDIVCYNGNAPKFKAETKLEDSFPYYNI